MLSWDRLLFWQSIGARLTMLSLVAAFGAIFWYAPLEATMGEVQKIFYIHVATAWVAFLAFFVVATASLVFLWNKNLWTDKIAHSAAEVGVIFTTLVLITGTIWAKIAWNTWWVWEPRLTTTLILWFLYLAYLIMRSGFSSSKGARQAAVFGIVAFLDVPLVYFSLRWSSLLHPVVLGRGGGGLEREMYFTLFLSVLAFTCLFFYLLLVNLTNRSLAEQLPLKLKFYTFGKKEGVGP